MSISPQLYFRYVLLSLIILIGGTLLLILAGVFVRSGSGQVVPTAGPGVSTPAFPQPDFQSVDLILGRAMRASISYSLPAKMQLNETQIVRLFLTPIVSEQELERQIAESGVGIGSVVEITPIMKAALKPYDPQAFWVTPLHDSPEQPVTVQELTRWQWQITAKQGGRQGLALVVYRLIRYENQDYWREVAIHQAEIEVSVTIGQRLQSLDWKWLIGLVITSLLIPMVLRWWDTRISRSRSFRKK